MPLGRNLAPGWQRLGLLTQVPHLLRKCGARPASVLKKVGLSAKALADPNARIPYLTALSLLAECARATECEHFGLLAASQWRLEDLGVPGEIAANCATVGQAVEQFTAIQWLNSTGGVAFVGKDAATMRFGYAIFEQGASAGTFQMHDLAIAIGVRMLRQLSGNTLWRPRAVRLAHGRPADVAPYRRLFGAPVYFDGEASFIEFRAAHGEMPVPGADEARRRALLARLTSLQGEDLLPKVYRMVRVALLFGLSSGDDVAAAMGLHRRTFDRRLREHGTSFRHALEEVRFQAAQQMLSDTDLEVAQVAAALGYSESSAFVRAFGRWSGRSPAAWRLNHR